MWVIGCHNTNGGSKDAASLFGADDGGAGTSAWWIVCPVGILWNQRTMNSFGNGEDETGPDGMVFVQSAFTLAFAGKRYFWRGLRL